jgi:hypothetical protein
MTMTSIVEDRPCFFSCAVPLVLLSAICWLSTDAVDIFALVPANTLITHTYTWNLATSCFLETSPVKLILDLGLLWYLAPIVGTPNFEQFSLYFVFSILASTIGTSIIAFFRFVSLGIEAPLVTPIFGFSGILICILTFTRKQLKGQSLNPRIPHITFHNLPIIFLLVQTTLRLIGLRSMTSDVLFAWISLFFSWSYLRYYYKFTETEPLGDSHEEFTFVGMFPEPLHIVLIPFTTSFHNLMALLGIFPPIEQQDRKPHHHLRLLEIMSSKYCNS